MQRISRQEKWRAGLKKRRLAIKVTYRSFFLLLVIPTLSIPAPERIEAQLAKVRAVYPEIDVGYLPAFVGHAKGIYKAEGLDVELIRMRGAREGIQALLAGDIQFTMSIGPALPAIWAGSDLKVLVQMIGMPVFSLIVRPEINKVEDLKSKKIGVSFGGMTFSLLHEVLKLQGLDPDKDVEYINIPGAAPKIVALEKGIIAATLLPSPSDVRAVQAGFKRLLFVGDFLPDLPFTGLIGTNRYIKENAGTVERMVRAIARAVYVTRDDPEAAIEVLQRYLKMNPNEAAASYQLIRKSFSPLPTEVGLRKMAEVVSKSTGTKSTREPKEYMDLRFAQQAASGSKQR